jgi:hypothetical protein
VSIGSGLSGSLGWSPEVTYGTYVAPTKWAEATSVQLQKQKNAVQGGGPRAGAYGRRGSMRYVTTQAGGGTIAMEVQSKRMGHLLNGLLGGTVTPTQQAATTAYLQTHTIGDPTGKFFTFQSGVPDLGGTVRPYTFLGSKITAIEFSCGVDQALTMSITVDSRDVTESETLAAPSYATGVNVFHFGQMGLKLGTYDSEAAVDGVRSMTLRIERGSRTDRYYANAAGLKAEPIINDWAVVSGSVEVDYVTKADFADRFRDDSSTALVWEFIGPTIESTYKETFRVRVPMIFMDGETPTVQGPDVVTTTYPWVAAEDGTNALVQVLYTSTDTAL